MTLVTATKKLTRMMATTRSERHRKKDGWMNLHRRCSWVPCQDEANNLPCWLDSYMYRVIRYESQVSSIGDGLLFELWYS